MEENNKKRKIGIIIVVLALVVVLLVSFTYAYFTSKSASDTQTITSGNLGLEFDDTTAIVKADNIVPIVREDILDKASKKTFSITNKGTEKMFVDISLEDITLGTNDKLQRYDFMYALYEEVDGVEKNISNGSFEYVEDSVKIGEYLVFEAGNTDTNTYDEKTYNLYIWIEETNIDQSEMMDQTFNAKISATATAYWASPESDFEIESSTGTITAYKGTDTNISIPSEIDGVAITEIGPNVFCGEYNDIDYDGLGITNVIIPNSVTSINTEAFAGNKLVSLTIPNSVTSISPGAFWDNEIVSLIMPNSVISIGEMSFYDNQLNSVVIPNSITEISDYAFDTNQLTNIIIPNNIESINSGAFQFNNLSNIIISDSVKYINELAFYKNQLTNVIIPNSVTYIDKDAFTENPNLATITLKGRSSIPEDFVDGWYDSSITTIDFD